MKRSRFNLVAQASNRAPTTRASNPGQQPNPPIAAAPSTGVLCIHSCQQGRFVSCIYTALSTFISLCPQTTKKTHRAIDKARPRQAHASLITLRALASAGPVRSFRCFFLQLCAYQAQSGSLAFSHISLTPCSRLADKVDVDANIDRCPELGANCTRQGRRFRV